jgi:hypothetical protein
VGGDEIGHSEQRKRTAWTRSDGSEIRPAGVFWVISAASSGEDQKSLLKLVFTRPGAMALTRMLKGASSAPRIFVIISRAALAMP